MGQVSTHFPLITRAVISSNVFFYGLYGSFCCGRLATVDVLIGVAVSSLVNC